LRLDPTIRHSFWTILVGGTIFWVNVNGLNQNMIQRYMALKDVKTARKGQLIYVVGVTVMIFLCVYNGLLLYATYHDCDPLQTKLAKAKDQLMPLLVMEILKDWPGLPGLFIAGVFSAALSSLSTGLNAMSAVVLEDFCKPFMKNGVSERLSKYIMRGTVLVLGVSSICLVYVVQHLGAVLQLSMSVPTACFGPMLGVYIVGFLMPWIGKRAVLYSAIVGCVSMMIIVFKAQAEMALGNMKFPYKPLSTDGCEYNFTISEVSTSTLADELTSASPPPGLEDHEKTIFHVSYLYYTLLGSSIVTVLSVILSFIFGFQDPSEVDPRLLAPFLRKYINSKSTSKQQFTSANGRDIVIHNFDTKENVCT
jgi:solute carrier family 5 (sodium-coupled monocarboxylate transporter), member 8/12